MSDIKKVCKSCKASKGIHHFQIAGTNHDGRSNFCNACRTEKARPYKQARKKEKEFWSQFSPI